MSSSRGHTIRTILRVTLQVPLLLVLFLGLLKAPLAHTCLPDSTGNNTFVSSGTHQVDEPCHGHENMHAPAAGDAPCCLLEAENCLDTAASGMLVQSYSRIGDQQPEAVTTDTVPYPLPVAVPVISSYTHAPPVALPDQHNTYLVTRRLRI